MNKNFMGIFLSLLLILFQSTMAHASSDGKELTITFPNVALAKGERVGGISVSVISGYFPSMPNIPFGWNVTVDNGGDSSSTIEGSTAVGAFFLEQNELQKLSFHVMTVKQEGVKFNFTLKVTVTSDFEHTRDINLTMKDAVIK